MYETTFARVARSLAIQFPPDWTLPPGLQPYAIPDRALAYYCRMTKIEELRACRAVVCERLECINNGWFYEHRGIGSDPLRAAYDKADAYHRLWWIDVFIAVYTR